ncbi:TIGR03943 family putative permease subunit [Mycolicibacterium brumae]|uniref:TIGR03943 family protein n=1 Tax=Mycolicibacterium brumae TaxID=85968 RepID=A0A2G5P6I0_9MYCO|nr:TIGR03943 family protein [Mycolicibacterium brumae]MCV7193820.1 TIGR03943 family protein [Mycolicibacterium brumae]PIB73978.1 TIGR03943 family protein [Mycolicibacterium brumae]RWA21420.1 hypothetical protein MBRU_14495 [Mycolicibacterium brumae DSM 44177]UWW07371.1 TIGR03943 family protein [Mycolicibacterium brumae]
MNRETENVLLLLIGVNGVMIVVNGTFARYVKPALMPWLLAGALLIVALALAAIIRDIRRGRSPTDGHHGHHNAVVWLLLIPAIVLTFVKPPPIGAQAADTPVAAAPQQRHPFPALPPGVPDVSLPDVLMRISQDSAGTLDGRRITVTGFTMASDSGPMLGRVVIICCAADAMLARIRLDGPAAPAAAALPENTWVKVEGEVAPGQDPQAARPALTVSSVTQVPEPAHPYAS